MRSIHSQPPAPARQAVLFKTYYWDGFVERQFARLKQVAGDCDVFILVDETSRSAGPIAHENVLRLTEHDMLARGFANATNAASLFWYNNDYLDYFFYLTHPHYAYYITVEHDVFVNMGLAELSGQLEREGVDYLGLPVRMALQDWYWFDIHSQIYPPGTLTPYLNCFSSYSQRALRLLCERRLEISRLYTRGLMTCWPISEAFIPHEVRQAGYRLASLDDFGNTRFYDWWPPMRESEVGAIPAGSFVHPLLDDRRYIASVLRHEPELRTLLNPKSAVRRRLAGFPITAYRKIVINEIPLRIRKHLDRVRYAAGLKSRWTGINGTPRPVLKAR